MLDIQFIRDNAELVEEKSKQKGYEVDIRQLLELDTQRRTRQVQVDELRRRRNEASASAQGQRPSEEQVMIGRELKEELTRIENELHTIDDKFVELLKQIPNMPLDHIPVGRTEEENVVVKEVGVKREFDFAPKPHWEIAEPRGLVDKERAAKIAGSRFTYLKGDLVRLQFALVQFVLNTLRDEHLLKKLIDENGLNLPAKPFMPVLPPAMLRTEPYVASARLDATEVTYKIEDEDLWLNASAEHTLCTMYWDEILAKEELPIRYIGYSTSFRREAGTYGKDTEGIIRLHQFDKLEMEVFSTAEAGFDEHRLQIALQEYLVQRLEIPYRFLQKCTADIGKPNASGVDIECWFPGQNRYIETHTADYMTDYQARDLKIRTRDSNGETQLVHTNDATALAMSRILAAIIENNQSENGYILIPEVLRPFMGGKDTI